MAVTGPGGDEGAQSRTVAYLLLMLLATLWGSSYGLIKLGVETIPPLTFAALRTTIAAAVLLVVLRLRGVRLPQDAATWKLFLIQGALGSIVPFTLLSWAQRTVDASLATILNSTSPIFAFLMIVLIGRIGARAAHHDRTTVRQLFGVAAGIGGVSLIVGAEALGGVGRDLWGQLAVVLASVGYAGAAVYGRRFRALDPMLPATGSLIAAAFVLIPAAVLVERPWTISPSATSVAALFALAVFSTALGLVIYFRILAVLGSVGTTAQAYLRVPVGVAIGVFLLGETLAPSALAGLVFVVFGVWAMTGAAKAGKG